MKTLWNRRLVAVRGEGVLDFLQGLVTQDMHKLGSSAGAVFLNAKGRMISDALFYNQADGVFVDVPVEVVHSVANMLVRHKLRLPLKIDMLPVNELAVGWAKEGGLVDPRWSGLPHRIIGKSEGEESSSECEEYKRMRLLAGIPEGPSEIPYESAIPIHYNFDLFNCISFNKGCYTGQELVTRTIRRGVVRKRVFTIHSTGELDKGTTLRCGERDIGTVIATQGNIGLAMLQLPDVSGELMALNERGQIKEAVAKVSGPLVIDGQNVELVVPGYMQD